MHCMLRLERLQQGARSTFALYEDVDVLPAPRGVNAIVNACGGIIDALAEVHAAGMIYGALTPETCLFGPRQVYLVDFGHASTAHRRQVEFGSAGELAGDLRYLAPELTGRTNRAADYRADFYALGAVLYHMLCGVPPFASTDPLELVYQHLAFTPEPMRSRVPVLPRLLDALVLKLLAKDPSQRYQSVEGLRADLSILRQVVSGEAADHDVVGRFDVPFSTFEMPHLYGRDRERALVMAAYERACAGSREFVLIEGYSGIGKSSLIRETYPQMTRQRATFASGKFELLDRSTPYSAWMAVLSQLVRHLLAEPESELSRWRTHLRAALQDRIGVLAEVVPELHVLFGAMPTPLALAPAEARERFLQAFCTALGAFGSRGRPVSVFLDDLQWIDSASLLLLERVLIDPACANVMLFGAQRSNEVDRTHALSVVLARLRQTPGLKVSTIELSPLSQQDIAKLVTYALAASHEDAEELAKLLLVKTGGNPFSLLQLLRALREEGLIRFDADRLRWTFDLRALAQTEITANVVDLILRRFDGLPVETRDLLARAAFIGSRFDAELIAEVCGLDTATVRRRLAPALAQEFVVALSDQQDADACAYRFLHDKLQEAAAAGIPAADRPLLHLRIARAMRHLMADEKRDDLIFAKAEHLNEARSYLVDRNDLLHVSQVNLRAAKRAASAAAFLAALRYATEAMVGVPEDVFETDRELARALYCARAEYEYLAGNFVEAEQFLQVAIHHESDRFVRADLFHQLIVQYTLRAEYGRAIDVARAALAEFEIVLAERDLTVQRDAELRRVRELQGAAALSSLGGLAPMTSPEQTAIMKLLIAMGPPCYRAHPELWGLIVATELRICLQHGVVPGASYTFPAFGGLGMHLDMFDGAVCVELCEATLALLQRVSTPADTSVGYLMIGSSLRHWFAPLSASVADYQEAYQSGVSSGNLQYAAYALGHLSYCRFFQGGSLVELLRELETARSFCEQRGNRWGQDLVSGVIRITTALLGRGGEAGSERDEQAYLARCEAHKNLQVRCIYLILKCEAFLHQGDYAAAAAALVQAWPSLSGVATQGLLPSAECELLRGVLVLLVPEAFGLSPAAAEREAAQRARRLSGWAQHAPQHFGHATALLEAQLYAARGDFQRALAAFERAMNLAEAAAQLPRLGLAAALCARLLEANGIESCAAACRQRAESAYARWRGGLLLESSTSGDRPHADAHQAADLDLLSVMRTAQALARSVELSEVVEAVIRIVAQVSGAQRVVLLLESEQSLRVVADSASGRASVGVSPSLPGSLINLVRRTGRTLRVQRGTSHEVQDDPYLLAVRPAAVLCTPLSVLGQVQGVLYMEHRELTSAFHQRHEVLVEMLAGTAAIAVRNAELVSALRRDLELRTALEQKARDSERRLTLLLEQSPLGMRVFRPSGELLFENAASLDGSTDPSNDNGNITLAAHPLLVYQPELMARVQRGESVQLGDVMVARDAAGERWLSGRTYGVTGTSGEIDQIVVLEEDISARKRTERMQSEFVSAVSHELRTPLTSIRGVLGLLAGGVCGALPEQVTRLVQVASDNAERLTRLVNDILDMEKLEAGKMSLRRSVLSVYGALETALRANEGFAVQHGVVLRSPQAEADDLALIRVDPDRLQQVLANLLSNAIKFSPEGGHVDVRIDVTETRVRVSVIDRGSGVPEGFRKSLFQRFVQADGSDTRRHGGTGLGLSITRQLVEQMGGTIEYSPMEPVGSCFAFEFPRVPPNVVSADDGSESVPDDGLRARGATRGVGG
ncbi:MAG TPA: AAA family ATPase [Polyangiales bacterium]